MQCQLSRYARILDYPLRGYWYIAFVGVMEHNGGFSNGALNMKVT